MTAGKILALIASIAAICVVAVIVILRFSGNEDYWLCENGQWRPHGNPSEPKPTAACPTVAANDPRAEQVTVAIRSDRLAIDEEQQLFTGEGGREVGELSIWQIKANATTKYYRRLSADRREELSFAELVQILNKWEGPAWPIYFVGTTAVPEKMDAAEIFYTIQ